MVFSKLRNSQNRAASVREQGSPCFSRSVSPMPSLGPIQNASPPRDQSKFLQLIADRITKKLFLTKQKQKFLRDMVINKKGKVIYEGPKVDNLVSLDRKIELFQEILRHIREKSMHKIHLKPLRLVFQDDEETLGKSRFPIISNIYLL